MKRMRKIVAICMVLVFMTCSVSKAESDIVVRSDYYCSASVVLGIDGYGNATCGASVDCYPGTSSISGGLLLYKNYKEYNQTLLKTWHVGTLTNHLYVSHTYKLPSRGTYTVVLNVTAFRDGQNESLNIHKTKTY
jgi:hypothetical protein